MLDLITSLVAKSLVLTEEHHGRTWYRLLETIRQYGHDRLRDSGRHARLRHAHLVYYRELAAKADAGWCGPDEAQWLDLLRRELPNFRSALRTALTTDDRDQADHGLDIALALVRTRIWHFDGQLKEGRDYTRRMLGAASPDDDRHAVATALAAWIAFCQGDQREAEAMLREARHLVPDSDTTSDTLVRYTEGTRSMLCEADPRSIEQLYETYQRFCKQGDHGAALMALLFAAIAAAFFGTSDRALALSVECLQATQATGAAWTSAWAQWPRSLALLKHGDLRDAEQAMHAAVRTWHDLDDRWGLLWGYALAGWLAAALGQHVRAAQLIAVSDHQQQITDVDISGLEGFRQANTAAVTQLQHELGQRRYDEAYQRGKELTEHEAVTLALGQGDGEATARVGPHALLTRREREVAALVADGQTNQQIATTLGMKLRTSETHVRNILQKLGATSRVQIATWTGTDRPDSTN